MTVPVKHYDKFLSHDWSTSQWLKFIALLIHFNCRAAAVACLIASLCAALCTSLGILPMRAAMVGTGYGVFFFFLMYWQSIRRLAHKPIIVFFDKLCISQDQEEVKMKSIYGLASFLDRSRELVILWSNTYFQRLWCTYERLD
eukprot:Skav231198  [mRNA]  locus=scaffold2432:50174:50674:+ [translate_table: standard]